MSVDGAQSFYGNPVSAGFLLLETYRPADADVLVPLRRFAGPHAPASFTGVESTAYAGPRRLFATSAHVGVYPRDWNTAGFGFVARRDRGCRAAVVAFSARSDRGSARARPRWLAGRPRFCSWWRGTYRYPFIIGWGSASTLGLLPAFFARQIDFELFGSGATDGRRGSRHMAIGGALTLGVALW